MRSVPSKFAHVCIAILFFLSLSIAAFAQSDAGTITGFVRDQSGAVVAGASVVITSEATGQPHAVTTDAQGHYTVTNLPPGLYTMTAELTGFKKFSSNHNTLNASSTIALDGALSIGQATETVEVSSTASQLQTESGAVQQLVSGRQLVDQELNGRNPIYEAQMLPGVHATATMGDFNFSLSNGGYAVNGARTQDTQITVDGAPALRTRGNQTSIGVGNVDTTQEIQVLTSNFGAEYGAASGGEIRIVTKSGTTDFHGGMYEYFRNNVMNANTWGRNQSTTTDSAQPFRYNNFGFAVGGPLYIPKVYSKLRNKFFWFVGQDWIRYREDDTSQEAVPTALMRQGNFSELLGPNPWYSTGTVIRNPTTNAPYQNNVIPASQLSPNGIAILNTYPKATPGYLSGADNWIAQAPHPINQRKGTYNGDIVPNDKNHITIRRADFSYTENAPFNGSSGLTGILWNRPNQTNSVAWTYTVSPTMVNELTATASADDVQIAANLADAGYNRNLFGINYPYIFPNGKDVPTKIPTVNLNDNFYSLNASPYPSHSSGPIYTLSDSVTKIWGNHTVKAGISFQDLGENDEDQINVSTVPGGSNNQNGTFNFTDSGIGRTSGASIANLALGVADSYTEIGPRAYTAWRSQQWEGFLQDSWKATSKLHIDYGVRFTVIEPNIPLWGNAAFFDPGSYNPANAVAVNPVTGNVALGSGNAYNGVVIPGYSQFPQSANGRFPAADASSNLCAGGSCNGLFAPGLNKGYVNTQIPIQPRLGIAYSADQKSVIRAGIGRFVTRMGVLDNVFPGGNSPFQPFVTVTNVSVDNPGASLNNSVAAPLTITTLNKNLKPPEAWNWNVTFERQMPLDSVLTVAYAAHRGLHTWQVYDINQPALNSVTSGTSVNAVRPYQGFAEIQQEESNGTSMYNSLQVAWNRRFSKGYSFGVSYTLSKNMDDSSSYSNIVPYTPNTSNLWGPSENDARNILVINYSYELPFFKNNHLSGKLLGGWQINGTAQFQSGSPCGIGTNNDFANIGEYGSFGCGSEGQFWNINGNPTTLGNFAGATGGAGSPTYFATTNPNGSPIFTQPAPGTINLQPGVRDSVYGPGFQDWNMALFKRFAVTEKTAFQFRAEAYDIFNHPNWSAPNFNPTSPQFGEVTSKTGLARNLQLSLRYDF
jgi:hypothetical protein